MKYFHLVSVTLFSRMIRRCCARNTCHWALHSLALKFGNCLATAIHDCSFEIILSIVDSYEYFDRTAAISLNVSSTDHSNSTNNFDFPQRFVSILSMSPRFNVNRRSLLEITRNIPKCKIYAGEVTFGLWSNCKISPSMPNTALDRC